MADSDSKKQKLMQAAQMLETSPGFSMVFPMTSEQWMLLLERLSEDEIDDYLLLLNEEQSMLIDAKKEEQRKKQVNSTHYLHRLERLKLKALESIKNKHVS